MLAKATVLALLTVLCLTTPNENNGENWKNHMDDWGANWNGQNNPEFDDMMKEINQEVTGIILFIYVIAFFIVASINIFLCMKCLKKRDVSKRIKEQMQMKRLQFATNHGFNIQTLNDPRYSQTIHM